LSDGLLQLKTVEIGPVALRCDSSLISGKPSPILAPRPQAGPNLARHPPSRASRTIVTDSHGGPRLKLVVDRRKNARAPHQSHAHPFAVAITAPLVGCDMADAR
jgi:hypothetical protein